MVIFAPIYLSNDRRSSFDIELWPTQQENVRRFEKSEDAAERESLVPDYYVESLGKLCELIKTKLNLDS